MCNTQDEIQLAENEVVQSLNEIKYNYSQLDKMIEVLNKQKIIINFINLEKL